MTINPLKSKIIRLFIILCLIFSLNVFANELVSSEIIPLGKITVLRLQFKQNIPVYKTLSAGEFYQIDFLDTNFSGEKTYPTYKNNLKLFRIIPISNENILRVKLVLFKEGKIELVKEDKILKIKIMSPDQSEVLKIKEKSIDGEALAGKYYLRALELIKVKEWENALQYLEEAKKNAPENERIKEAYELCMTKLDKLGTLKKEYDKALTLFNGAQYDKASEMLEVVANKHPDFLEARELLMKSYFKMRKYKLVVKEGRRIIELNPLYDNKEEILDYIKRAEDYQKLDWGLNKITFSCDNEPIQDVLYALSKETGLKFDYNGPDDLKVSLELFNATIDDLMSKLFKENNLEYTIKNGIVKIKKSELPENMIRNVKFYLPLGSTLKAIAELMNINIIINPEVDINKSVNLTIKNNNISKKDLMDLILKNNNLVKIPYNETTFFIVPKEKAKNYDYEEKNLRIFKLSNIEPEEFLAILKSMKEFSQKLDFTNIVAVDLDSASNIISTRTETIYKTKYTKDDLDLILQIKEKLNKISSDNTNKSNNVNNKNGQNSTSSIEPMTKAERLEEQRKKDEITKLVGEEHNISSMVDPMLPNPKATCSFNSTSGDLSTNYGTDLKVDGTNAPFKTANLTRKVKAIMVFDTKKNLDLIERLVNQFDIKRPQVLIAVKIVDINQKINEKLGLLPSFDGNTDQISVKKFGAMSRIQLDATLNFLETKNFLKTLSNPTIRALDGVTANVVTGKDVTIRDAELREVDLGTTNISSTDSTTTSTGGKALVNIWVTSKVHTGIKLKVTPYINGEEEITMKMTIEQQEKSGKDDTLIKAYLSSLDVENGQSPEADYPDVVEKRNFDTTIRMKDGETVVIGGLISENNDETNQKTPFINRLPVIGKLFSQNVRQNDRSEMVILVTPYIVNKEYAKKVELASDITNSKEYTKFMENLKRRLR